MAAGNFLGKCRALLLANQIKEIMFLCILSMLRSFDDVPRLGSDLRLHSMASTTHLHEQVWWGFQPFSDTMH
eukprot:17478-Amphidinium_carterae.1